MLVTDEGNVSADRDAAIAETVGCEYCHLTGLVSIFHRDYAGTPTIEVKNRNGEPRKVPAVIAVHCVCPVGDWARRSTHDKTTLRRIPSLHDLLSGKMPNWRLIDPTLPECDVNEEPDWKAFRAKLAAEPPSKIIHVKPSFTPSRAAAYREMGEPIPVVQEQHHPVPERTL